MKKLLLAGISALLLATGAVQAEEELYPGGQKPIQPWQCGSGKMEFRLGSEQRVCGPGDVVVIPGGTEHEGWFREDSEVIDFFAPPREDFLLGGKPAYMSEG
jgi:unsaturated pyranuronate lyase